MTSDPGEFVMPFGKYKGRPISQVPAGYLAWLVDLPDIRPATREAVQAYLHPPELPMEGREPDEPAPKPARRPAARRPAPQSVSAPICCARCGQPGTETKPLVHGGCVDDDVPF